MAGHRAEPRPPARAAEPEPRRDVQIEVVHWYVPVFGHHQIQSNKARVGLGELEAEHDLSEHHFSRKAAQHLVEVANRHLAA